jgi:peptide/nickel transport system substrate-binding protein
MKQQTRSFAIRPLLAGVATVAMIAAGSAIAGTPKDMLVHAKNISDTITLDPAEVFEFTGGEVIANVYDRVMMFEPEDLTKLVGGVAESFSVSDDGKTVTLKIRAGQKFHSGNPVTAKDVAYSLQRVIKLKKTPSFIFTQFGWDKDNVDGLIKATGPDTVAITINSAFSPGLMLNALSAGVGSVVDMQTVEANAKDGDMGYAWLKNNSAASGAFSLKTWKANELIMLEANQAYRHGAPKMNRVVMRHIAEPSAQRLLLEKGDADLARDLTPDQIKGLIGNKDVVIDSYPMASLYYVALNGNHPQLAKPEVKEAIRYAIDYKGMESSFLAGQYQVHQSFWPSGLWGAYDTNHYSMDLAKAKSLIDSAGASGMKIQIDTLTNPPFSDIAQSIQQSLSKIGVNAEIVLSEGKTLWPKYRARKHEAIVAYWSPDYVDPHSNADAFAHNPDNRDEAKLTGKPAWRTGYFNKDVTARTEAAAAELDSSKRLQMYMDLQKEVQTNSNFIMMFQKTQQLARRANVKGYVSGANFDMTFYRNVTK